MDVGVDARTRIFGLDAVGRYQRVDIVAIVETGFDHLGVGLVDHRFLGEFIFKVTFGLFERTVKEPADEAERKDIAAFQHGLVVETAVGERRLGHCRDGDFEYLCRDAEFFERFVGLEHRLAQIGFLKRVDVDDDHAAGFEKFYILLERRGVHGDKHIAAVAGSVHACSDAYLKTRHAAERSLRSANFSRIVGKCRDLIAKSGRYVGESVAGKLHAVARVARETHYDLVERLDIGFF